MPNISELSKVRSILYNIEIALQNGSRNVSDKDKYYPFIGLNIPCFIFNLKNLIKRIGRENLDNYTFVDFGSGYGIKLEIAHAYGFKNVFGFELQQDYINKSCRRHLIKKVDLTTLNKEDFPPLDRGNPIIAYYYRPIMDLELEIKFENNLNNILPVGSYLFGWLMRTTPDSRFKKLSDNLYKKIKE